MIEEREDWERKIEVFAFDALGFRIAEISVSYSSEKGSNGYSYMRCDPDCADVILWAENFVIYSMGGDKFIEEDFSTAKETLKYLWKK